MHDIKIGSKIQLAIATNVILAILLGEFIVTQTLGLSGTTGMAANLAINGVIAFVYGLIVSRAITRPLKEVVTVLQMLSQGKGDLTHRLKPQSNDEIGDLSRYFNTFLEKLHSIIYEVSESTCKLASVSDEMRAITRQSADNLKSQQKEANQAAMAMQEMANTVQEIAHHASEAEQSANQANQGAHNGTSISSEALDGINALVVKTETAATAIEKVASDVGNIGMILDVIKEITDQTNLLALNAAIEAARAGEQGRGFAVVADEVRTLARRTHDSTLEIQDVITQLQSDAEQAVSTMGSARKQAQTGAQHVDATHLALNEIVGSVKTISDMNTQIATTAEQQKTTTKEVGRNISTINQISQSAAESADEIKATSHELFDLSQQLEQLVGQFELSSR
ncbi:methyl-accepting chemotaxis protein [Pseudomonadota bacterium]